MSNYKLHTKPKTAEKEGDRAMREKDERKHILQELKKAGKMQINLLSKTARERLADNIMRRNTENR